MDKHKSLVMPSFTAQQISDRVEGELIGPGDLPVRGVEQLDRAAPDQISFVRDQKNAVAWEASEARVVLASQRVKLECKDGRTVIRVANADLAMAIVLGLFAPPSVAPMPGIHQNATVDSTVSLGQDVAIGPGCVVGDGVTLGDGCVLHANVCVMDESTLGRGCQLYPGVVIRERCELGDNVIIHANAVIGADGFGYTPATDGSGLVKIPQIGTVTIGNDVEIGAGTCIDRGKHASTTIGDGTKIDNLCQIAHNCQIGRSCALAAQVGLAGSVTIGDGVRLGGNVGIRDQVNIGNGATIAAYAAVMGDVPEGETWGGYPAQEWRASLRQMALMRKLADQRKTFWDGHTARQDGDV